MIAAISPQLEKAEIARVKRKPTENLDAYDIYLRGMAAFHQWTREGTERLCAISTERSNLGRTWRPLTPWQRWPYARRKGNGWMVDRGSEIAELKRLARQAARLGQDDAVALSLAGFSLAQAAGQLDDGAAFVDRALVLNPNHASVLLASGWVKVWLGELDQAIEHLNLAISLSPLDPFVHMMLIAAAHAHFFAGRLGESVQCAEKALRVQSDARPGLRIAAASYALAGRAGEASTVLARLRQLEPHLRVSNLRDALGAYRHQRARDEV